MTYCSVRPVQDYLQECRTGRPVTTEQINGQTNRFETTRRRESCHGNKDGHDSARRWGVFISMCLGACIHHESSHPHRNANSPERNVCSQPGWGDKFKRKCGRSVKWELTSQLCQVLQVRPFASTGRREESNEVAREWQGKEATGHLKHCTRKVKLFKDLWDSEKKRFEDLWNYTLIRVCISVEGFWNHKLRLAHKSGRVHRYIPWLKRRP